MISNNCIQSSEPFSPEAPGAGSRRFRVGGDGSAGGWPDRSGRTVSSRCGVGPTARDSQCGRVGDLPGRCGAGLHAREEYRGRDRVGRQGWGAVLFPGLWLRGHSQADPRRSGHHDVPNRFGHQAGDLDGRDAARRAGQTRSRQGRQRVPRLPRFRTPSPSQSRCGISWRIRQGSKKIRAGSSLRTPPPFGR